MTTTLHPVAAPVAAPAGERPSGACDRCAAGSDGAAVRHLPWREDQGMMGPFLVVEPGRAPDLKRPEGDSDDHHDL